MIQFFLNFSWFPARFVLLHSRQISVLFNIPRSICSFSSQHRYDIYHTRVFMIMFLCHMSCLHIFMLTSFFIDCSHSRFSVGNSHMYFHGSFLLVGFLVTTFPVQFVLLHFPFKSVCSAFNRHRQDLSIITLSFLFLFM